MRPDGCAGRYCRLERSARMHTAETRLIRVQQARHPCVIGVGIRRYDACAGKVGSCIGPQNHCRGMTGSQLPPELRIAEEGNVALTSRSECCHPGDTRLLISKHIAAQLGGDLGKRERELVPESHYLASDNALMTRSVISRRGLTQTTSCRIRSYFSDSAICLIALLAFSITAAFSSF